MWQPFVPNTYPVHISIDIQHVFFPHFPYLDLVWSDLEIWCVVKVFLYFFLCSVCLCASFGNEVATELCIGNISHTVVLGCPDLGMSHLFAQLFCSRKIQNKNVYVGLQLFITCGEIPTNVNISNYKILLLIARHFVHASHRNVGQSHLRGEIW